MPYDHNEWVPRNRLPNAAGGGPADGTARRRTGNSEAPIMQMHHVLLAAGLITVAPFALDYVMPEFESSPWAAVGALWPPGGAAYGENGMPGGMGAELLPP